MLDPDAVKITWTQLAQNQQHIGYYQIYSEDVSQSYYFNSEPNVDRADAIDVSSKARSHTDTDVEDGKVYRYWIDYGL